MRKAGFEISRLLPATDSLRLANFTVMETDYRRSRFNPKKGTDLPTFARTNNQLTVRSGRLVTYAANTPAFNDQGLELWDNNENTCLQSRTFDTTWTGTMDTLTRDQVGFDYQENTAWTVGDTTASGRLLLSGDITIAADTATHCMAILIKKNSHTTAYPAVRLSYVNGGANINETVMVDTYKGRIIIIGSLEGTIGIYEYERNPNWWRVWIALPNDGTHTAAQIRIFPAYSATWGGAQDDTAVGQVVFDNVDFNENAAYPGPVIVTTTTAVTLDDMVTTIPSPAAITSGGSWTIFQEMEHLVNLMDTDDLSPSYFQLRTDADNRLFLYASQPDSDLRLRQIDSTTTLFTKELLESFNAPKGGKSKVAVSWDGSTYTVVLNSLLAGTQAGTTAPSYTNIYAYGHINESQMPVTAEKQAVFPYALSTAEMKAATKLSAADSVALSCCFTSSNWLLKCLGQTRETFTRTTIKYVQDYQGVLTQVASGDIALSGLRIDGSGDYHNDDGGGNTLRRLTTTTADGLFELGTSRPVLYEQIARSTAYSVGDIRWEYASDGLGYEYECTAQTSATAASAPTFANSGTTTDGGVTWTALRQYSPFVGYAYDPQHTNEAHYSREFENAWWTKNFSPTIVADETGIDGVANSARTVTDSNASDEARFNQSFTVSVDTKTHYVSLYVKSSTDTNRMGLTLQISGGTTVHSSWALNRDTGTITAKSENAGTVSGLVEEYWINGEKWWRLTAFATNNGSASNTTMTVAVRPAVATSDTDTWVGTAQGSIVCDQLDVVIDSESILSPVVTSGGTGTYNRDDLLLPIELHDQSQGMLIFNGVARANNDDTWGAFVSLDNGTSNLLYLVGATSNLSTYDDTNGETLTVSVAPGDSVRFGVRWNVEANEKNLAAMGTIAPGQTYDGAFNLVSFVYILTSMATHFTCSSIEYYREDKGDAFLQSATKLNG